MTATATPRNRYLEGVFAPVREEVTVTDLAVTGTLPPELDGRYLRNGPNPIADPDPRTYHWFLGTAMVHGVRLRDGRAEWYRNRWVRSPEVADALGEPRRTGPVHAGFDFGPNTHVIGHAGRTFAIVEAGARPYELTDDLDTIGPCDFDGTLPGGYTAHPKRDPETGELHAVSYFFGWGDIVQYSVLDPAGRVRRTVDLDVGGSLMMHDFSLTAGHVVLYDLPVTFDLSRAAAGSAFPYGWDDARPARVGVMPREGGSEDVEWFEVEPCYVYHPLNAYDDGPDRIVLDVVRHPRMFATDHNGPNEGAPTLDRWTVDRASGKVVEERLDDRGQEFPRIDERRTGRRHRYGYAARVGTPSADLESVDELLKHDLDAGTTAVRRFPGAGVGEFVFVPREGGAAEDDGYLMGFVHHRAEGTTDLAVLQAATLEPVATVHLPVRVPLGFHGSWIPTT